MEVTNNCKYASIYIVGAQCTGKTTLTNALYAYLISNKLLPPIGLIKEAARGVLLDHHFTREDIESDPVRCMQLQNLILQSQLTQERQLDGYPMLLSDRSGCDPLVYAAMYGPENALDSLLDGEPWRELRDRMRDAVVVVCEPVTGWLFDDGVRLMPKSEVEWFRMHRLFCSLLSELNIEFVILPCQIQESSSRVEFVAKIWQSRQQLERDPPVSSISG